MSRQTERSEPIQFETITSGTHVRITAHCPIDFEGAGPVPGEVGRVVALPGGINQRGAVAVSFERLGSPWIVPIRFLELID